MMGAVLGGGEDPGGDPAAEAADKADRLGKVQFLFNIKEGKRSSIEQRITREVMMSVSKELAGGAGGDVSKMMEAFSQGSGKGSPTDLEDLMNQVAGGTPSLASIPIVLVTLFIYLSNYLSIDHNCTLSLSPGGGQLPPDMPNVENMSQAEISSMLKESMSSVSRCYCYCCCCLHYMSVVSLYHLVLSCMHACIQLTLSAQRPYLHQPINQSINP